MDQLLSAWHSSSRSSQAVISDDLMTFPVWCLMIGIWILFWILRTRHDEGWIQELALFIAALAWRNRTVLQEVATSRSLLLIASCTAAIATSQMSSWSLRSLFITPEPAEGEAPWLLPSRTSHTRFFPKKHSFAYSLLQVAVPVGSRGRFGSLISVGEVKRRGWFHVQASDYLERNSPETDLRGKLRSYLREQGVEDSAWSYAYLITAPRFLGYSFNPVSFWYIYTSQDVLTMMILEVNNTFDERRMYLLQASDSGEKSEDSHSSSPPTPRDETPIAIPKVDLADGKFRKAWTKDFHVSPFNSRKGYYMLTAIDPFTNKLDEPPIFSNTITLKSSKDHVKLVARIFSHGKPINPATSSWRDTASFVMTWFWVGFLTFPRILKEAAVLFWSRGLHVWLRPEVMTGSIGRKEAKIERDISHFFETYLEFLVRLYPEPLRVLYTSNLSGTASRVYSNLESDDVDLLHQASIDLKIRVTSPAFFSRFVHYAHSSEAFDRECVFTDEKNRTIWMSSPDVLYKVLEASSATSKKPTCLSILQRLQWKLHTILRCPPPAQVYPSSTSIAGAEDIRRTTFSELDRFVTEHMQSQAAQYRRLCARSFLSQRLAFGFVQIIDLLDFAFRAFLLWLAARAITDMFMKGGWGAGFLLMATHTWRICKGIDGF